MNVVPLLRGFIVSGMTVHAKAVKRDVISLIGVLKINIERGTDTRRDRSLRSVNTVKCCK